MPSQTTLEIAAWVSPNAASRANETRFEPRRSTTSNSSMITCKTPVAERPTSAIKPTAVSSTPTTVTARPALPARRRELAAPPTIDATPTNINAPANPDEA